MKDEKQFTVFGQEFQGAGTRKVSDAELELNRRTGGGVSSGSTAATVVRSVTEVTAGQMVGLLETHRLQLDQVIDELTVQTGVMRNIEFFTAVSGTNALIRASGSR